MGDESAAVTDGAADPSGSLVSVTPNGVERLPFIGELFSNHSADDALKLSEAYKTCVEAEESHQTAMHRQAIEHDELELRRRAALLEERIQLGRHELEVEERRKKLASEEDDRLRQRNLEQQRWEHQRASENRAFWMPWLAHGVLVISGVALILAGEPGGWALISGGTIARAGTTLQNRSKEGRTS